MNLPGMNFYFKSIIVLITSLFLLEQVQAQCLSGDCKNGKGIYLFPSGAKYIGFFKNGECHGIGVCYFTDGSKYQGNWKNRFPEGHGIKTYSDGTVRNGYWKKGRPVDENGNLVEEIYIQKESKNDGTDIQAGCLTGNCISGDGVMTYVDGSKYEGQFSKGKITGFGTWYYPNGEKYVGNFSNGLPTGKGTLYKQNGTQHSGSWRAGEYIGEIKEPAAKTGCISGNCQNGRGVFLDEDTGNAYEGQFVNKLFNGTGIMKYANGDIYNGQWKDGKYYGNGKLTRKDGTSVEGNWIDGEFNPLIVAYGDQGSEPGANAPKLNPGMFHSSRVWAVVVGISQYSHMPVLRYSDDDAYKMYAFLKSPDGGSIPDERIKLLIDEDATKANIRKSLKEMLENAGPDDVVMFYFAGHGLKGSFLPIDFDGYNFKLTHEEFNEIMKNSRARLNLCVIDACHSGGLAADNSISPELMMGAYYDRLTGDGQHTAILLSSKSEETSLESKGLRQGVFSHFLLRGLKGEADLNKDSVVTIKELFEYVSLNVKEYTEDKQTPEIKGEFDAQMPVVFKK